MRIAYLVTLGCLLIGGCNAAAGDVELTDDGIADAKADAPVEGSALTSEQSHLVLAMFGDHCADAWCEGQFNYAFKRFTCKTSKQSCTLTVIVIDEAEAPTRTFWRSCKIPGLTGFDSIVETSPNGFQDLSDTFFERADECMTKIEDSIPAR